MKTDLQRPEDDGKDFADILEDENPLDPIWS
jgi:hypothetical protein